MVNGMTPASRAMRAALKLMWPPRPTSMRTPRSMASKISGCTLPSRDTNAPGCFVGQTQRRDAPARVAAGLRVTLDALDDVAVLLDGVDRFLDVDAVRAI